MKVILLQILNMDLLISLRNIVTTASFHLNHAVHQKCITPEFLERHSRDIRGSNEGILGDSRGSSGVSPRSTPSNGAE